MALARESLELLPIAAMQLGTRASSATRSRAQQTPMSKQHKQNKAQAAKRREAPAPKRKRGRPTIYSRQLADNICSQLAEGTSLREICRKPGMPSDAAVRQWALQDVDGFHSRYAHARELQAEKWADELVSLSDNAEDPQKARLQVDTRKWLLSKLLPKRYGERQTVEHTGANGGPIQYQNLAEDEIDRRLAELSGKLGDQPASGESVH
jgi:hypothetical protein